MADIAAGIDHAQRQIANHTRADHLIERAFDVEQPGKARCARLGRAATGGPAAAQVGLQVGVGELHALDLYRHRRRLARGMRADAPAHLGAQPVERQHGFFEHAGQVERSVEHRRPDVAAALVGVEFDIGLPHPGSAGLIRLRRRFGVERQPLERDTQLVLRRQLAVLRRCALRLRRCVIPAQAQAFGDALRVEVIEPLSKRRIHRQALGQPRHQRQVQPLGAQFATAHAAIGLLTQAQRDVAGGPAHTIAGEKAKAAGSKLAAGVGLPGAEAAGDFAEPHRLETGAQAKRHIAQGHIKAHRPGAPFVELDPGTQRALALIQIERQGGVLPQGADVGARQVGIGRALPALPVATVSEQRLRELGHQRETLAPLRWRRGIDAHLVLEQGVAHHQLHVGQRQRRGRVQLIDPAQRAAANGELMLIEEPVGQRRIALAGPAEIKTGDEQLARLVAMHLEVGALNDELLEEVLPRQHGMHRQGGLHPRQAQRQRALRVKDLDVSQLQRGRQAARGHDDLADANRVAEHAARALLDGLSPAIDVRQNGPVQSRPDQHQQAPRSDQQVAEQPHHAHPPLLLGALGVGNRGWSVGVCGEHEKRGFQSNLAQHLQHPWAR